MKKTILWMRKIVLPTLLALAFSVVMVPVEMASPTFTVTQSDSTTMIYLDSPTINGTIVGQEFTVNINIRDADEVHGWQAGLIFDPTVLGCTGFFEGEFLGSTGRTQWSKGTIDNATGVITPYGCSLYGLVNASGDGRLAFINFTVIAPGVSDLHFRDAHVSKLDEWGTLFKVPINIIDVYTVVEVTPPQTVVIVSNSTGSTGQYHSGFYDHFFNLTLKEISFIVTGPKPGFSNITIPKPLLNTSNLDNWIVIIDDLPLGTQERTATENTTHTFLYFTYSLGIHEVQITTRPLVSSTVSINLSSTTVTLGNNVTISGNVTADDPIDPVRENATVTIQYRLSGGEWAILANVTTDANSNYVYVWTSDAAGTYEVKASWTGDSVTLGAESNVLSLTVLKMSSTISINLSSTTVTLGNNVTISGAIDPWKAAATVTVRYRLSGGDWVALANVTTDANSDYVYVWTSDAAGTYEVKAMWTGDKSIEGDESDPPYPTLTVEEAPPPDGIDPYVVAAVVVAVIIIAAIAIYFVKFRKPG